MIVSALEVFSNVGELCEESFEEKGGLT